LAKSKNYKLLIKQFPPNSCHFISLPSKYSPQHPKKEFKKQMKGKDKKER
jgi:hypothetical protein